MFNKVKKWLGIEGTRVRLYVLPSYPSDVETINGEIEVYSKRIESIKSIHVEFFEVYSRGRGEEKRINEYKLGEWHYHEPFEVSENFNKKMLFQLPFERINSPMDDRAAQNSLKKGLVSIMKSLKGVHSDFYLKGTAIIEGSSFYPSTKAKILFQ